MNFRIIWTGSDEDPDPKRYPRIIPADHTYSRVDYYERDGGIVRYDLRHDRGRFTSLTNFTARLTKDIVLDDGENQRREFFVEANLEGVLSRFQVPAVEFGRMNWVLRNLGPRAIVFPGQHQHARTAIQQLSRQIRQERIFTHLGWRKHGEQWVYLHAGGALGKDGPLADLSVQLPSTLQKFELPASQDPKELAAAICASLRCLSLAPDPISIPLLAAVYRAPFGKVDFSVFLTGKTGVFKTALAALAQQHFGPGLGSAHLPGHFGSTANALEMLAFDAKDSLVVIDDFAPTGRHGDDGLEGVAGRLFRSVGNHQGRARMSVNGRLRPSRPPRALLLGTGEDVPKEHSIRARLVIVSVAPQDVDLAVLSECQRAADDGKFAASMSAYISWIARDYEKIHDRLSTRTRELRQLGLGAQVHPRLPAALSELQCGFEMWLEFAADHKAISTAEHSEWIERSRRALEELAQLQAQYHQAADPALRYLSLLQLAISTGRAHLASRSGAAPDTPARWGWRSDQTSGGWTAQGALIGWTVGDDVFLEPASSYQIVQETAGADRLPISQLALHHRLQEKGLLASLDPNRQMVQIRRTLEGYSRQVLHLKVKDLLGDYQEPEKWGEIVPKS